MNSLKRVYQWFHKLPKQIQDSIFFSVSVVGFFSTIFTVLGASLKDFGVVFFCLGWHFYSKYYYNIVWVLYSGW